MQQNKFYGFGPRLPQSNDEDLFDEYDSNNDDNDVGKFSGNDATTEAAFISVPLMIEEVGGKGDGEGSQPGDPTVILAGSPEETGSTGTKPDSLYKSPGARRGRENNERRGPHAFHQFLVEPPNAKRNADWSQRLRERQRRRVWRQFNLDWDKTKLKGGAAFSDVPKKCLNFKTVWKVLK